MKLSRPTPPAFAGRARSIYENVAKKPGAVRSQGFLRLESDALGTQSSIDFNIIRGSGNFQQHETEQRLNLADAFVVTEIGLYILKVTTANVTRTGVLRTFPNAIQFSGSGEAANLMNIYNGNLQITNNGEVIESGWDCWRHYRVGNAQKGILTAASGTGNAWDESTWDAANYGMYPVTPQFKFDGGANTIIKLQLPASVSLAGTNSTNYAVLIFRGFLDQNGSTLAK